MESRLRLTPDELRWLEQVLGKTTSSLLSHQICSLNSLIDDPLLRSTYLDMAAFPGYIFDTIRYKHDDKTSVVPIALKAIQSMSVGADIRSYGAFNSLEEVPGLLSTARGGVQQAIQAAELLVAHTYKTRVDCFGKGGVWDGFLIAQGDYPFHLAEVISMPVGDLLNPHSWWTLYHETAHAIILGLELLSRDKAPANNFLRDKLEPGPWHELLEELVAEVIGYEMGFYGDLELYSALYWKFLGSAMAMLRERKNMDLYVLRAFFVQLYAEFAEHFNKDPDTNWWPTEDECFLRIVSHIEHVASLFALTGESFSKNLFAERYYLAANFLQTLFELQPICKYMCELRQSGKYCTTSGMNSELDNSTTILAYESIMKGDPYFDDLLYPSAVFYWILKNSPLALDQRMALIKSFSHKYVGMIWDLNYGTGH